MPDPTTTTTTPTDQSTSWMQAGASVPSGLSKPTLDTAHDAQAQAQQAALRQAQSPPTTQPQTGPTPTPGASNLDPKLQYGAGPKASPETYLRPKRRGLLGVMDKIADAMTGNTRPEIYTDDQGNEYVYHPYMSRGQQWMKIAGGMFKGAAAGLAAGRGAGNMGKAALAGVEVGEQGQKEDREREEALSTKAQKDMVDRANMTMLRMNTIEQGWKMGRLKRQWSEEDAAFSQKTLEFYVNTLKGTVIGSATAPNDLGTVMGVDPDIAANFMTKHIIEPVAMVDPNGKAGVTFVKMPNAEWRNQTLPPKTTFSQFNPATDQIEEQPASDAMTMGQWADMRRDANNQKLDFDNKKQELENKKLENKKGKQTMDIEAEQRGPKLEGIKAETEEHRAGAFEKHEQGEKAKSEIIGGGGLNALANEPPVNGVRENYLASLDPGEAASVREIGEGRGPMPSRGSSARAMKVRDEVNLAYPGDPAHGIPGYDESRYSTYQETRKKFAAGSDMANGNMALNTAMGHMLKMYNAATWLGTVPIVGAAMRVTGHQREIDLKDAQTALVDELGKAYKNGAITQKEHDDWAKRIESWSPLEVRGNAKAFIPLLRSKISANEYQFKMGAPPGFVAPMEFVSPDARNAWETIMAPPGTTHVAVGDVDGKRHYLGAQGQDLGSAEYEETK